MSSGAPPERWRLTGQNIVCFSTADWDTLLPTNKHQLMRRFAARGNRVLFIETLGTRAPQLGSGTDLARIGRRVLRGFSGPVRRAPRLWSISPVVRPAWKSLPQIALNRSAFRLQCGRALARFPNAIAWVYSPYAIHLLEALDPKAVVYHMVDDLSAVPGADVEALREAEAALLARADAVFCTERSLFSRARRIATNVHFMPNVADHRHFSDASHGAASPLLAKLDRISGPRLVFSGNLAAHKVDFALLAKIAKRRRDWSLVMIGPSWEGNAGDPGHEALRALPNVHFLGHVPYEDLPAFLHRADVLLIPYVVNAATRAVSPLKLFEYLSTGKPVVATALPSLRPYKGAVNFAGPAGEWIDEIERALRDPELLRTQRLALARRRTWERRIREMERVLRPLL